MLGALQILAELTKSTTAPGEGRGFVAPTTPSPAATPTSSFFERLTSVDLLHIDDLGAEKRSDWVLEQLYALVNERYETQRSVLITTNLPHEELEEQIGPRTVSRLTEICDEVAVFGDDRRYGKYRKVA